MFIKGEIKLFFLYTGWVVSVPKYNPILRTGGIESFEKYTGYVQLPSHTAGDLRPLIIDKESSLTHAVDIIEYPQRLLAEDNIIGHYLLAWTNEPSPSFFINNDEDHTKSNDGWHGDPEWQDYHDDSVTDFNLLNTAAKVSRTELLISAENLEQLIYQKSNQGVSLSNTDVEDIASRTKATIFNELKVAAEVVAKLSERSWGSHKELADILINAAEKEGFVFPVEVRSLINHLDKG